MKYLVENESDTQAEPIISEVAELTLIDPAAGSGHILVEGFICSTKCIWKNIIQPKRR